MTNFEININSTIGIFTYDYYHLKTEQVVHNLLRKGYKKITLLALPFSQRAERTILIPHRPNQFDSITTEELASANKLSFIKYDGLSELIECDYYLIAGAGILPAHVIQNKQIINAHPGLIPSARGLDSFKWSIYENIPLGVTLHFVDETTDSGKLISTIRTPIYNGDSLMSLARRHYELEIEVLTNFSYYLCSTFIEQFPVGVVHRRMPAEIEAEMVGRFDYYKRLFAIPSQG
jgi:phosphoribosylglycinamide formyltransferase-1